MTATMAPDAPAEKKPRPLKPVPDFNELAEFLKAMAHPTKLRIVHAMMPADAVRSPNQLSKIVGETLGSTSYHIRFMTEKGVLVLVRTEPRRGALEHYYKLSDGGRRVARQLRL